MVVGIADEPDDCIITPSFVDDYCLSNLVGAFSDVERMLDDPSGYVLMLAPFDNAFQVGPGGLCSPRHRLQFKSRNLSLKYG
jgi:hypothetical protein